MSRWLVAVLGFVAFAAFAADDTSLHQWKVRPGVSLFDVLQEGYTVVSVASFPDRQVDDFYLQKGASLMVCKDQRFTDEKTNATTSFLACYELVKPYRGRPTLP